MATLQESITPQEPITTNTKLNNATTMWNKNFIAFGLSYIFSAFANGILRFAVPLYILYVSESPALFGVITAVSSIPMILMSPIGGIIADRFHKKRLIIGLDVAAALASILYVGFLGIAPIVPLSLGLLIVFFSIKGMLEPVVDSAIPLMVPESNLATANSISLLITMLAGILLGPAIGGVLFAHFGIEVIMILAVITFSIAIVLEFFMTIPVIRHKEKNMLKAVKSDFKDSIVFMVKEEPIVFRVILGALYLGFFIQPIIIIGFPVIISQFLYFSSEVVGFAMGAAGVGGFIGAGLAGAVGDKLKIKNCFKVFVGMLTCVAMMGIGLLLNINPYVSLVVMIVFVILGMGLSTVFSITTMTYIQKKTPPEKLGKILSVFYAFTLCAPTLGALVFGFLFQVGVNNPGLVVLGACVCAFMLIARLKKHFDQAE